MMDPSRMSEFRSNLIKAACIAVVVSASALQLSCGFAFATGGTSGTGYSQGPIEDFGSILVGDVWWDIDDAEITFDDEVGLEELLDFGQVVTVEGTLAADGLSGSATRVSFDDAVEGVISEEPDETVPGVERELEVLGRTVVIDVVKTTFAGGATFEGLDEGHVIEVSGLVDGEVIYATWVELLGDFEPNVSEAELRGVVEGLIENGDGSGEFDIGTVKVRYDGDTELEDFEGMSLMEGQLVEAIGVLTAVDELIANEIELEKEGLGIEDADSVELTGIVSGFVDAETPFTVSGVLVDASDAEIDGLLEEGAEIEVEGPLVGGVLIAEEIEVEGEG